MLDIAVKKKEPDFYVLYDCLSTMDDIFKVIAIQVSRFYPNEKELFMVNCQSGNQSIF